MKKVEFEFDPDKHVILKPNTSAPMNNRQWSCRMYFGVYHVEALSSNKFTVFPPKSPRYGTFTTLNKARLAIFLIDSVRKYCGDTLNMKVQCVN